jgi:hypothetical protein
VPLNAELVGKTYPAAAFRLDAERVSAFAAVIGHPSDDVPPTIVTVPELAASLQNVVGDADLDLDLSRVLHAEQEYDWGRPLTIGETLTAEATIADIRTKGGVAFLTLRTEIRDESSRVVAVATSTLVVRDGA